MDAVHAGESLFDTEFWVTSGIIFILLCLSGLFSGSETALTASSRARIHHMAKAGDKRAERVSRLTDEPERLIGAILLGNNLVNILASAMATSLFLHILGDSGVYIATAVMTGLVLIFSEVLPKSYAIANPDRTALSVAGFIRIIVFLFAPVVALVQSIVRLTLRIFGIDISNVQSVLSAHDELRGTIELHRAEGGLVKEDTRMLGSILDLDDVTIEDVMIHRKNMQAVDVNAPADDIITTVVRSPFTRLPVYDGDPENIVGVLHAKDVLRAFRRAGGQVQRFNVRRIMIKPWFVPETTSLKEQLNAFLDRKIHFALVVDEYGAIQGLVTLEDILEEIVGDIADEHDFEVPGVQPQPDGSVQVEGTVTIRDLNRMFDWHLPDDEATTIAGLVIHEAETIPIVGKSYTFHGFRFEVTARRRNQITGLRVKKLPKPGKA
ncbi:HlyC/CorC family transporter [Kordiimonas marina]|uniref:HlyC/CorC family transporter n=1 Tax=Kordiimonas marina TaxID=2872312 RepID=UPI001FF0F924|nr:HlyC/CorC family transporter [Kordiimonas marina]MCJ9430491.1 HlyC/CorC family transporter [Kordiimonas marina]